ncbi:carbohydrate kinase family protein [Alterinioella nitratireducens]|uniref:carbohydrate kinase family protein n=1 Tax=Alterinioella nitratireducens TaxID=2735915 RepID=UPI004059066E
MILCCGEALIDMLPRQSESGEAVFAPYPGGAVFNTSVALGRLGVPVGLLTGLSRDLFGQRLERSLQASHVAYDLAIRSDRPTTLAFVTLKDGQAQYAFYDENTAGRMLAPEDMPGRLEGVSALFFGGISLAVEPCAEAYAALCLREAGTRPVMLDPNIRPGFIKDEARYRERLNGMLAVADIVKLSDEDLVWLEGDGDLPDLAAKVLARGPKLLCLTEGASGVTGYTGTGSVFVEAEKAQVVDTVGAGDTFNAGFLASLHGGGVLTKAALADLSDGDLRDALALGARAAAITMSRAGANPPWAAELQ